MSVVTSTPRVVTGDRLTIEEWLELPEGDGFHVEVFEGVAALMNPPTRPHTWVVTQLIVALGATAPPACTVLGGQFGIVVRDRHSAL